MYLKIYQLDPTKVPSGVDWNTILKKTKVELELVADTDILLMVEK